MTWNRFFVKTLSNDWNIKNVELNNFELNNFIDSDSVYPIYSSSMSLLLTMMVILCIVFCKIWVLV